MTEARPRETALDHLFSVLRTDSTWGNEGKLAIQLAEEMEELGFEDVRLVEPLPGRPSVVGRIRGTGGGRAIILNGHLDIYEISSDWTRDPWQPAIEGDRIYGAGIADEKAGTAGLFAAACEFLPDSQRPKGDIIFMGVSAHFEGGLGTRAVLNTGVTADGAITCEPSNLRINAGHRGAAYLNITTYGKQAHTSAKEQGYNAITAMTPVIHELERLHLDYKPDSLGGPIVNIGTIHGGTKHNQVPDRCDISIDVRVPSTLSPESVLASVEQLLERIASETPGFHASAEFSPFWLTGPRYPSETKNDEPIVEAIAQARLSAGLAPEDPVTLPVWSDMCVLNGRGIPTVNLGPGGPPYNWADEYVAVDEYLRCIEIYKNAINTFCNQEV